MPHIVVKMYPGRTDHQKKALADEIVKVVVITANCEEKSVSVGIEEISPEEWADKVYRPDILEKPRSIFRRPGYNPLKQ